jgi:hypothetical protein
VIAGNKIARVSPSNLDSFRYWQSSTEERGITEAELIKRITTPFQEDSTEPRIQKGIDLHRFMDTGDASLMKLTWDVQSIIDHQTSLDGDGVHEVWISGDLFGLFVPAKADVMNGIALVDYKVTKNPLECDDLIDAMQWRMYLALSGCEIMHYRVFETNDKEPFFVKRSHTLTCHRYPEMMTDIHDAMVDYLLWANTVPAIVASHGSRRVNHQEAITCTT